MDPIAITEFLVQQGGLERGLSLDYNGKPNRLKGIHRANEFFLDYLPECSYSLSMRHNDPKITKAFSRYFQEVRGKQDEAGRGEFYEAEIEQGENGKGNENKTKSSLIYRVIDTFLRYFHIAE